MTKWLTDQNSHQVWHSEDQLAKSCVSCVQIF